jgi:hypothetical protein
MSVTILLCLDPALDPGEAPDSALPLLSEVLTDVIDRDLGPDYGENWQGHYTVRALPRGQNVPTANERLWLCRLVPHIAFPAYGYHTLDGNGFPSLYVDVRKTLTAGHPLSLVLSHEIDETVVNPLVDAGVLAMYGTSQAMYYQECCDPCEGQPAYWHRYKGVDYAVANYVRPRFWNPRASGGVFDRGGYVAKPLTPAPGGAQTVFLLSGAVTINADGLATPTTTDRAHLGMRVSRTDP